MLSASAVTEGNFSSCSFKCRVKRNLGNTNKQETDIFRNVLKNWKIGKM